MSAAKSGRRGTPHQAYVLNLKETPSRVTTSLYGGGSKATSKVCFWPMTVMLAETGPRPKRVLQVSRDIR